MSVCVPAEAEEYHSKDFEWETLKQKIEDDPSLQHHLLPFHSLQQHEEEEEEEEPEKDSDAWKKFHSRHSSGKFFKERRYLLKEFPELVSCGESSKLLEVGCGNGSTALPILRGNENINVYACDCSSEILERAKEFVGAVDVASLKERFHPFHCDFCTTGFPDWLACDSCRESCLQKQHDCFSVSDDKEIDRQNLMSLSRESSCCIGRVDFITLIFTLSAVPLQKMPTAIKECYSVLKPGGLLFFRDYGLYDMTMLRFNPEQRVGFREYMRSDGTRSYFFSIDTVRNLFLGAGFIEVLIQEYLISRYLVVNCSVSNAAELTGIGLKYLTIISDYSSHCLVELEYCCVKSVNRRKGKSMERVWVHGKFQKPF